MINILDQRITSSRHGPYKPGYSCATKAFSQQETIVRTGVNPEKLSKYELQAATRLYEAGIASNRK